jgi:phage-related protein
MEAPMSIPKQNLIKYVDEKMGIKDIQINNYADLSSVINMILRHKKINDLIFLISPNVTYGGRPINNSSVHQSYVRIEGDKCNFIFRFYNFDKDSKPCNKDPELFFEAIRKFQEL